MKALTRQNSKGFSLMEIMVAAGLLGVLSVGVMKITSIMSTSQKKMARDFEVQQLMTSIATTLANKASCERSLVTDMGGALSVSGGQIQTITAVFGGTSTRKVATSLPPDNIYGKGTQGRIQLDKMEIDNFTGTLGSGVAGGADLILTITRLGAINTGPTTYKKTLKLSIIADASGNVSDCRTEEHAYNEAMCSALGGSWNVATFRCDSIDIASVTDGIAIKATASGSNSKGLEANVTGTNSIGLKVQSTGTDNIAIQADGQTALDATGTVNVTGDILGSALLTVEGAIASTNGSITATNGNLSIEDTTGGHGNITAEHDITSTNGNIVVLNGGFIRATGGTVNTYNAAGSSTITGHYLYATQGIFADEPDKGDSSIPDNQVVTAGWVTKTIADNFLGAMDATTKNNIYGELLNSAGDLGYETIRTNILAHLFGGPTTIDISSACTADGSFIAGFKFDSGKWKITCRSLTASCTEIVGTTVIKGVNRGSNDGSNPIYPLIPQTVPENGSDASFCTCPDNYPVLSAMIHRNGYKAPRCRCCKFN